MKKFGEGGGADFMAKFMLFELEAVADMLKVDLNFVIRLIKSGKIPFADINGSELIRCSDLIDYVQANMKQYDEIKQEIKQLMGDM